MYGRILETLCLYQTQLSDLYPDQNIDLSMLIDGVHQCAESEQKRTGSASDEAACTDDGSQLYHSLLAVLATSDGRKIPWGKKSKNGRSLVYQVSYRIVLLH